MRSAAVVSAAVLVAGFLIAYHPHPFGWGASQPGSACAGACIYAP